MSMNNGSAASSWKTSNLPLFGTCEDKAVKKHTALLEEAWRPVLDAKKPRVFVWKVQKFKIKPILENDYGNFFNGDAYIVLKIGSKGIGFSYDIHTWNGLQCSPDEYAMAAYKAVELDVFLDCQAIQHREIEGHETKLFKSYFKSYRILNGGTDSGFHNTDLDEYRPRLLHFHQNGKDSLEVEEVHLSLNSLDSSDVFILDLGAKIFQWNGTHSNKEERYGAAKFLNMLVGERNGKCKTYVLDEMLSYDNEDFMNLLPNVPVPKREIQSSTKRSIHKLTDQNGILSFELVMENVILKSSLTDKDVHFIDTGNHLFVYIGARCPYTEKLNAISYAHNFLKKTEHPFVPITILHQGQCSPELNKLFDKERGNM